jgi:signal transduction histidine kinase
VRLLELIDRARAGNRAHFEVRQLRFEVECAADLIVPLDRELFARVFENLLDNAARYAPRDGRCTVTALRDAEGVEIAVGNNGPPVPEAERKAIFGRYFQVEARRAAARANRGLGLYFCKLAVEAHGGTIHVEQRGDLGAVFVVRVPLPP